MAISVGEQRARDGAFFEDWSEWSDLGSPARYSYHGPETGHRPNLCAPRYHCTLLKRLPHDGRAGFEVCAPSNIRIARALMAIPDTYQPKLGQGRVSVDTFYVLAEQWSALRNVLPTIKSIIEETRVSR